jgi:hypothetical protein
VTSQGHAFARFRRAIAAGQPSLALEAAGELPQLSLADALELCRILARAEDPRFEAAARRWLARFAEERRPRLNELLIAGAALAELGEVPWSKVARETLGQLLELPA